jgi:predicted ester cyclase
MAAFRTAFPDLHFTIEDMVAEGDEVVVRWSLRGTRLGNYQGHPPTGKPVSVTGISRFGWRTAKSKRSR